MTMSLPFCNIQLNSPVCNSRFYLGSDSGLYILSCIEKREKKSTKTQQQTNTGQVNVASDCSSETYSAGARDPCRKVQAERERESEDILP